MDIVGIFSKKCIRTLANLPDILYHVIVAKTRIPALEPGTELAQKFTAYCELGWRDERLAVEFDMTTPTVRKYRKLLAPHTTRKATQEVA